MPQVSEPQLRARFSPTNQDWYDRRRYAVFQALNAKDLKGARVLAEDMEDPWWRSVTFSEIAGVTHATEDFETARTAALQLGVTWWRSMAFTSLVGALAKVKDFDAIDTALEQIEDSFWRNVARKHIAEARKH